jgi:hypothetical protein
MRKKQIEIPKTAQIQIKKWYMKAGIFIVKLPKARQILNLKRKESKELLVMYGM